MFTDGSAIASGHWNVISGALLICDGNWKHHICRQWKVCCRQVRDVDVDRHHSLSPDTRFSTSFLFTSTGFATTRFRSRSARAIKSYFPLAYDRGV
jgi:hypothetical protein